VLRWEADWEVGGWRDRRASRTSFSILWMSPQNRNLISLAKPNLARAPNRVPVSDERKDEFSECRRAKTGGSHARRSAGVQESLFGDSVAARVCASGEAAPFPCPFDASSEAFFSLSTTR